MLYYGWSSRLHATRPISVLQSFWSRCRHSVQAEKSWNEPPPPSVRKETVAPESRPKNVLYTARSFPSTEMAMYSATGSYTTSTSRHDSIPSSSSASNIRSMTTSLSDRYNCKYVASSPRASLSRVNHTRRLLPSPYPRLFLMSSTKICKPRPIQPLPVDLALKRYSVAALPCASGNSSLEKYCEASVWLAVCPAIFHEPILAAEASKPDRRFFENLATSSAQPER